MDVFSAKLNALPANQRKLYPKLAAAPDLGFVLYGGTALALRLGHRVSVDFDFFSDRRIDKATLRRRIPVLRDAVVLQSTMDTLTVSEASSSESVKVSFFGELSFGRVGDPSTTSDGVLQVASTISSPRNSMRCSIASRRGTTST
jgi:hypothetical protein